MWAVTLVGKCRRGRGGLPLPHGYNCIGDICVRKIYIRRRMRGGGWCEGAMISATVRRSVDEVPPLGATGKIALAF